MSYEIIVLPEADADVDKIYEWIRKRSPSGAARWYARFLEAIESLASEPERCGIAPENEHVVQEIRQLMFRTSRGRTYRALFRIAVNQVHVLHIRGPGQKTMEADEL